VTIETHNVHLNASYAATRAGVKPGPHVLLSVTDTGCGMDLATQERAFEPFFTTKEKGKGTGLGLSTVFGIVKQHGGHVWLWSEPGRGATFKIYLPSVESPTTPAPPPPRGSVDTGSETILLVDDDEGVRRVTLSILTRAGYHVLVASSAAEALALHHEHPGSIHLLLTDVVMPLQSGPALAAELKALRPDLPVIYLSGYTDDAIVHHGLVDRGQAFLQKPIAPAVLTRKIREVLGKASPAPAPR
jgi:two-component system cell cycle sensor histidine kinase/response regulator CckA